MIVLMEPYTNRGLILTKARDRQPDLGSSNQCLEASQISTPSSGMGLGRLL